MDVEELDLKKANGAFLVSAYSSGGDKTVATEYVTELARLCDTFGLNVAGMIICPIKKFDAGMYLGKGKLEEIRQEIQKGQVDVVIFDDEISPHQQKNLETFFGKFVIDRTELIIEVFSQRAQTREARLQIELAKLQYQFPRLKRMWTHLSRQSSSGGGHVKGEGEKQIEIDRRLLRRRMDVMRKEIEVVVSQRATQRTARKRSGIPTFAIVGYTNAGKSTLLNLLTEADVLAEDKLFATLDTTTRKFVLPSNQEVLLVDTVGFIRKIPHTLVAAFKSTLEEAVHTDVLLHVIDVSHPLAEDQAEATLRVLKELEAIDRPMITVLNKVDACTDLGRIAKLRIKYPKVVLFSAVTKEGLDDLIARITEEVAALRRVVRIKLPQSEYGLVSELCHEGKILSSDYEENDILLTMEIPAQLEYKVKAYLMHDE